MLTKPLEVRILGGGGNWTGISSRISLGLSGYYSRLPKGSTVAAVGTDPAEVCYEGIIRVANGVDHMSITTPAWFARLALKGLYPFEKPLPLRALAGFRHDDRMGFAVKRSLGIKSLKEIRDNKIPLKVSTAPPGSWHPAYWGASQILKEYGFSFDDMVKWGGTLLADRPRFINDPNSKMISDDFDAVFDEAMMTRRWKRLTDEHDLVFLPLEEEILQSLTEKGWERGVIAKGRFRGVDQDIPAADYSGWLLYCREDMDEELAYLTIAALDEQREDIEKLFPQPFAAMTGPADLKSISSNLPIPLHAGAEKYYREKGAL